jgi:eukaryotic-like serine/threonine-protein kinase
MAEESSTCPQCGARLADHSPLGQLCPLCLMTLAMDADDVGDSPDPPDTRFGPYRLIQKIGEGGMGIVWLARQEHPIRRDVALKVIKPGADSAKVLARFESERQALAILNHPNIATVFDAGLTDDGRPYFAMEYVPGLPITTSADERALPIVARLELFLQVCSAVEHAHQKGVLHRDLKPANILVGDRDGQAVVKVIDFGVAKAVGPRLTAETAETELGSLVGTPEYMSPEQAGLTEAAVDTRTDIYSLGLVLYELLVGALPFDASALRRKAVLEMLRVIREEEPPRLASRLTSRTDAEIKEIARRRLTEPRALVRQVCGDLEWITNRALEKEPARRYASASELGADVRRHLASEPVVAGPPDLQYRLGKLIRRHRASAIGAGIAITALVVGTVVSSVMWVSAERARRENRDRLKTLHVTTGLQLASDGNDLKALPWLVRALQLEEGGARAEEAHRIRIHHVLDGIPYPVRLWKHDGLIGAHLAPDRRTLATWDHEGTVRLWDATNGNGIAKPLAHPAPIVSARIARSRLVTADEQGTIHVWDTQSGKETLAASSPGSSVHLVRVSADGTRLLSADRAGAIVVRALESGSVVASVRLETGVTFAEFLDGGQTIAAGDTRGWVSIVEVESGRTIARLQHDEVVADVTRLDAQTVATTTHRGVLQVWDVRTNSPKLERTPVIPNGVDSVRFSADRASAFLCGLDGGALAAVGRAIDPTRLGTDVNCLSLDLSDDRLLAATAHANGTVRVWSANGAAFTPRLPHAGAVSLVGFLAANHQLITADSDGVIRVWELGPSARWARTVNRGYTWVGEFSPDGQRLALASGSSSPPDIGQATVLDAVTGEILLPPLRHGGNVRYVTFNRDGKILATASDDGTARLWDAATGEPVSGELRHAAGPVASSVFSPDGHRLLTLGQVTPSSTNGTLWEVPSGRRVATLPDTESAFTGEFSPDGSHFVTVAPGARRVRVWRTSDGQTLSGTGWSPYGAAAFLSNSQIAVAGIRTLDVRGLDGKSILPPVAIPQGAGIVVPKDGTALVVATETGAIHVLRRHDLSLRFPPLRLPGAISAAQVSADNRWLIGASWERRARIWSMETGEPLTPERSVPLLPLSASFSPDGLRVQISGREATIWELTPDPRPVVALEKLSQFLSGHELPGTQLVTLAADRLVDLARDPMVARTPPSGDDRTWRWMIANQYQLRRNWSAVEAALTPLATDTSTNWEVHAVRGSALAELGRWAEAQRAFTAALGRQPDSTQLIYYEALARAAGGEASAIDTACAAALQRFRATRNPDRAHWLARLCVLSATLDEPTGIEVRELARIAADIEPDIWRHVAVHAAALVRANDPAAAEKLLAELVARPRVREREEETQLVLALAQRRLGRVRESDATVSRYEEVVSGVSTLWYRRLEADRWRRRIKGGN